MKNHHRLYDHSPPINPTEAQSLLIQTNPLEFAEDAFTRREARRRNHQYQYHRRHYRPLDSRAGHVLRNKRPLSVIVKWILVIVTLFLLPIELIYIYYSHHSFQSLMSTMDDTDSHHHHRHHSFQPPNVYNDTNHTTTSAITNIDINNNEPTIPDLSDKGPIFEILQQAGIDKRDLDDDTLRALPTWTQIRQLYGDHPRIIGLERCTRFQSRTFPAHRFYGVAGTFNTGTNLLAQLILANCQITENVTPFYQPKQRKTHATTRLNTTTTTTNITTPLTRRRHRRRRLQDEQEEQEQQPSTKNAKNKKKKQKKDFKGMRWQVPWGKHYPADQRGKHISPAEYWVPYQNSLPLVTIRDPYQWMQSMCRTSYAAFWPFTKNHCPTIIPTEQDRRLFPKRIGPNRTTVPVTVRYSNDYHTNYTSFPHWWNEWYQLYYNATYPRIMIRYEDLLFYGKQVIEAICACGGGVPRTDRPVSSSSSSSSSSGFVHVSSSAKLRQEHVRQKTDLLTAIITYGSINQHQQGRLKSMTPDDIQAAKILLDSNLMNVFGYTHPSEF